MALPAEIEGEDATLRLFFSLAGRHPNRPVLLNLRPSRQWRLALTQVGRGLANRVWLVAERLGLADRWQRVAAVIGPRPAPPEPSWADYEAWIASLQPRVAERDTPGAGLGNWRDEPWRQVLQIAVSWLNHAAKTLDSVAERLSGAGNWAADDRIGIRAPGDASR
jgi:hypothetical protein